MTPSSTQRLDFIDSTRGIAAFLVLIQHSFESAGLTDIHSGFGHTWLNLGQAGVVAFFLVSGFVIPLGLERSGSLKHFALGRVARIYPLYLAILIANTAIINLWNFQDTSLSEKIKVYLAHFFFLQEYVGMKNYVGASWTLSVEAVWYVLFATLFAFGLNKRHRLMAYAMASTIILLAVISLIENTRIPLGRLALLQLCIIGLLSYRYFSNKIAKRQMIEISLVSCLAISIGQYVAFGYFTHSELSGTSVLFSWGAGAALFYFFYVFREYKISALPPLKQLGTYSYSIYLTHPLLINLLERTELTGATFVATTIFVTLITSIFTYRFIELPAIVSASRYKRLDTPSAPAKN